MTHPAQVIVTHMETLLPMSVGMSMHRFSSSPGRSNAMLYMFLVKCIIISLNKNNHLSCSASSLSSLLSRARRLDSQWMMKPE